MSFSQIETIGPPRPDQIEICIFGPSYGECIVVHVGNGHWIILDSCSDGVDREPVSLAYLKAIGVDPSTAISAIVATHWHDDHCKGFSRILSAAPSAHVWIASVLTHPEFLRFAARMGKNKTAVAGNKLSEFRKTIEEIRRRERAGLSSFGFAHARTQIFCLDSSRSGHGYPCQLMALSPSHGDVLRFLDRLAADMPRARQTKIAVPSPTPNHVSIATLLSIGPTSILLGADLESSGTSTAGWEAVIVSHMNSPLSPTASVYKIPHHGSENAHNADVWTQLLDDKPFAALTPWRKGKGRLPTKEGIAEIVARTPNAFSTAADARSRLRRVDKNRPPGVLRALRENRRVRLRSLNAPFGAVRFRTQNIATVSWQYELFGAACPLKKLLKNKAIR